MVQSDKDSTNVGQKYPGPESRMEKKATQNEKAELHPRQIRGPFQSLSLLTTLHCRKTDQKRLPGDYPHVGVSRLPAIHTENVLISREPSLTVFESLLITVTLIE